MGGATQKDTVQEEEEEEPFELPTLKEVARATGTLRSEPIGEYSNNKRIFHLWLKILQVKEG